MSKFITVPIPIKSSKYVFTLKNVNTEKVDNMFGISLISNILSADIPVDNITRLTELNTDSTQTETISFLDEMKKAHNCTISMIDFRTQKETLQLKHNCYWCRHSFNTSPIGCPINYISSQAVKSYNSHISKDMYTIKEDVTISTRLSLDDPRISVNVREYYETDGIFCSFNCCKAFIIDNKNKKMYNNSLTLLMRMYNEMLGTTISVIDSAPHWRLLQEYGGHLSITEFRKSFDKAEYEEHGIINNIPSYRSVGFIYEERIKF